MTTPPLADEAEPERTYSERLVEGMIERIVALEQERSAWKDCVANLLQGHPDLIPAWTRIKDAHGIK